MKRYTKFAGGRGFTLIELLVVIAIIGILSSVVLVSLNSARGKGVATRIQEDAANIRTQLETDYTSSYSDLHATGNAAAAVDDYSVGNWVGTTPTLGTLKTDITTQSGYLKVYDSGCNASGLLCTAYSIEVSFPNNGGYCVDSTGNTATI